MIVMNVAMTPEERKSTIIQLIMSPFFIYSPLEHLKCNFTHILTTFFLEKVPNCNYDEYGE